MQGLVEVRNLYGTGHGKDRNTRALSLARSLGSGKRGDFRRNLLLGKGANEVHFRILNAV